PSIVKRAGPTARRCSRRWGQERFPISRPRHGGPSRASRPRQRTQKSTERTSPSMTASANAWWPRAHNLMWLAVVATPLCAQTPDYQNPDLPFERRAADLVSRMTLEGKVSQMQDVAPPIHVCRDPRWGRGQETYGEDPFLTGRLAVQFIRGMEGDDPRYLKTVATVKHFAVHSGPEPARHTFDAVVGERDLRESYLPHFAAGMREGGAYSLMCAYNRVLGSPACGSDLLLHNILRGEWGFSGYVVSDCGAI